MAKMSQGEILYRSALDALQAFEEWTHVNEAEWSAWGEQIIPAGATFWRVKAGQALAALKECDNLRRN